MTEQKPVFDPTKNYTWKLEDKFEVDGKQFMIMLGAVRAILETEEAARIQLALQASLTLQNVLEKAVIEGIAVEEIKK